MCEEHIKLVRWPRIVVMFLACFAGAFYRSAKELYETGSVDPSHLFISILIFVLGIVIIFFVVRQANKSEV